MRFTLPKLFLVVAMTALACAGMLSPTHGWASSIVSLTVALFVVTAIRAIGLRGRERAFVITFAIVGGSYLLAATCFQSRSIARALVTNYPLALFALAQERVPIATGPTYFAAPAYYAPAVSSDGSVSMAPISPGAPAVIAPPTSSAQVPPSSTPTVTPPSATILPSPPLPALARQSIPLDTIILMGLSYDDEQLPLVRTFLIGHCVWSWLIALLAGWFAGRVYAQREN
jgi:hypothetical protein